MVVGDPLIRALKDGARAFASHEPHTNTWFGARLRLRCTIRITITTIHALLILVGLALRITISTITIMFMIILICLGMFRAQGLRFKASPRDYRGILLNR